MTKESLRSTLLDLKYCKDSNYLNDYINLIFDNVIEKDGWKTQKHHIIPRHYFIHNNLDVDNTEENIVELSYKDHIKAHIYLAKCCINIEDIKANSAAALYMTCNSTRISRAEINSLDDIYEFAESIADDYNPLTLKGLSNEHSKIRNSNSRWFNDGEHEYFLDLRDGYPTGLIEGRLNIEYFSKNNTDKIAVNNGIKSIFIDRIDLDKYISLGYSKGLIDRGSVWRDNIKHADRSYIDDNFRAKVGETTHNWYKEHPGFKNSGMWGQRPPDNKGKIWITNGFINKYADSNDPIPDGWRKGCIQKKKKRNSDG